MHNIEIRMAQAGSEFGRLNHIWRDKRLSKRAKLKIYATFIISILAWGVRAGGLRQGHPGANARARLRPGRQAEGAVVALAQPAVLHCEQKFQPAVLHCEQ